MERAADYQDADPFPHIYFDGLFSPAVLHDVLSEFPAETDDNWIRYDSPTQRKRESADAAKLGPATRQLVSELNGPTFLLFLERLTGIERLIADPHLNGGGLHEIEAGGSLSVHLDFTRNEELQLDRRLNLLLYLNEDWKDEYGGHLELWDRKMTRAVQKIAPVFNRCAVFTTSTISYHGHPDPLRPPAGRRRRSLALYYYTSPGWPSDAKLEGRGTDFRSRPGERDEVTREIAETTRAEKLVRLARRCAPPILLDGFRALRDRAGSGSST